MAVKNILGLDLGTNSIGWALIEQDFDNKQGKIVGSGSRIIPMSQDVLGKFDSGVSISQTAERTGYRGVRRLRERHLLRRERLHRVLNLMGFLPEHYSCQIDFEKKLGQFKDGLEPKIAYKQNESGKSEFIFKNSFNEMVKDFAIQQPALLKNKNGDAALIPYDWTIYFLRQKALKQKIEKEEIAWLLLHFNQKRGYYQLRGEEEEQVANKLVEFYSLKVVDVVATDDKKTKEEIWYNVHLENGWIYRRTSKVFLDWTGKIKDFIVTTDLNDDGSIKTDKDGKEKRSFRAPAENDWTLVKKKTEHDIEKSKKTVGQYIYDSLLQNPNQKIKGKLVRVVERNLYVDELRTILETQEKFHTELQDADLYKDCIEELYPYNEPHKGSILNKGFSHLFLNDIIFYQRPLKSKKSLIANCKFEQRYYRHEGVLKTEPLKGIAKSHPLFQEFRLWQFLQNLRIFEKTEAGDIPVTHKFIYTEDQWADTFEWLNDKKEVDQKSLLKRILKLKTVENYRWNYVEDKDYPCNSTRSLILLKLKNVANIPIDFLTKEKEEALWHILYSVDDKVEIVKALKTFASKNNLNYDFVEQFKKFPRIDKEYGSYSEKALKKLLPLMRVGKYWSDTDIIKNFPNYKQNIHALVESLRRKDANITEEKKEEGKSINHKLLERLEKFNDDVADYKGIEHFLASYLVYGKHSEDSDVLQWKYPLDIDKFLHKFGQHSLRNPIVEQVITETLRVVKDIWNHYGNGVENFFDEIHLELGREMKNPADRRKEMTARINENENTNLRIKALLTELLDAGDVENVRPFSPMQQEILKIYEEGVLSAEDGNIPDEIIKISKQAIPASSDLKKYKLWLEQGYHSPYTGKIIPLSKLFTRAYDIEHIIPISRYFDDSLSNKVICETDINTNKDNMTAFEYMTKKGGSIVQTSFGNNISLLTLEEYVSRVKRNFIKSRSKMKKLLMEEIPEAFIQRQMNDSRYISKVVKNLLSNIVREDDEQEAISKKVVPVTGAITAQMKQDWGLEHIWNELITPRFIRLNGLTNSQKFGDINPNTNKFLPQVPLELQKGFSKKRIDHRHHALDAIVIACVTKDHINYLNSINSERKNYSLVSKLRETEVIMIGGQNRNIAKAFKKPWEYFTQDSRKSLEEIVVSYKQNLRVINKTVNHSFSWQKVDNEQPVKKLTTQTKGDSWAIRKPMHKDTVSGLVQLKFKKQVSLAVALENPEMIVDRAFKKHIKTELSKGVDKKNLLKGIKEANFLWEHKDVSKIETYYWDKQNAATRVNVDERFDSGMIKCITDTGIQKIMFNHLAKYNEEKNGKIIEHPELAFSPDGLDLLNRNIIELNNGKAHHPIFKVRTFEPMGNKFAVGQTGNKGKKFVEAAKGTNLFFAIYQNEKGKRNYETIPLNIVIERQKQGLTSVPDKNSDGDNLLMFLSPNDLVYVPGMNEEANSIDYENPDKEQVNRIYKMVSFSGTQCFFVRHDIATSIVNKFEFSALNKTEKSLDGVMIKDRCIKLKIDRIGNIKPA